MLLLLSTITITKDFTSLEYSTGGGAVFIPSRVMTDELSVFFSCADLSLEVDTVSI